jgi:hypothetical protein
MVLARLPESVRCVEREGGSLALLAPVDEKMTVLRVLASLGDLVEDVDIQAPGLQQLYRQWIESSDAQAVAA